MRYRRDELQTSASIEEDDDRSIGSFIGKEEEIQALFILGVKLKKRWGLIEEKQEGNIILVKDLKSIRNDND